jgi:hypothetical protein
MVLKRILLVDFSNIAWATFHTNIKITKDSTYTPKQVQTHWKYLMLNSLQRLKVKHQPTEMVICFDSYSWRKKYFKYYKARREITRKKSKLNYSEFVEVIDEIKEDLRKYFPFKVVQAQWAEADDIIAVLVYHLQNTASEIIIASRDKDFKQLLNSGVKLWDTHDWKWIKCPNPRVFLIKHVIGGDAGDDVPNIRSDSDTFITDGKRQKACGPKTIDKILEQGLEEYIKQEGLLSNFKRNKRLIRLSKHTIPDRVWEGCLKSYDDEPEKKGNYQLLTEYFGHNRMRKLAKSIDKFF